MGGACSTRGRQKRCTQGLVGRPEGKNHLEDPGLDVKIILKMGLQEVGQEAWTGLIWLRIGTDG